MPSHFPLSGRSPDARRRSTRLGLETLEDRTLLASSLAPAIDPGYASDRILVQYQQDSAPVALAGSQVGSEIGLIDGLFSVKLDRGTSVESALATYRADARVLRAEADRLLFTTATPNDARYSEQWSLNGSDRNIHASSAWDRSTGSSKSIVSVMDTGIDYTHPDLYQNIYLHQGEIPADIRARLIDTNSDGLFTFRDLNDSRNQGAGKIVDVNANGRIDGGDLLASTSQGGWADDVDSDNNGYRDDLIGWDFADDDNNPYDDNGHGTHVSGILGATGNNGVGVTGINWTVQLMPIRFIAPNGGSVSQFIAGLNYAVANGAKISNNSWTGAAKSDLLIDAVAAARVHDHLFVAAAGNNSTNNDTSPTYPANLNLDNVITVAATDRQGALANFSNYGATTVDLAAPGVEILSTYTGGGYAQMNGTSMATPHVAGVAALVWAKNPTWTYKDVIAQIRDTVEKSSALTGKVATGGIVNASAALGVAQSAAVVAPKIVSSVVVGPSATTLSSIRVTFDKAMNLATFTAADAKLTLPSGQVVAATNVKEVAGSAGKTFDIVFPLQSAPGTYKLVVGPYVADTTGVNMATFTGTYSLPSTVVAPKIVSSVVVGPTSTTLSSIRVTFDKAINLATFSAADAKLTLPSGQVVAATNVKEVAGSAGKTFDIVFPLQSAPGTYKLVVGPYVADTTGVNMTAFTGTYTLSAVVAPVPKIVSATASGPSASTMSSVRVTFDKAIQLSTFTAADCVLTGPNGVIAVANVKLVSGSGDRVFDVVFATQSASGTYTLKVGPNVKDLAGTSMAPFTGTYAISGAQTYTSTTKAAILPGGRAVTLLTVNDALTIADLNVKVNVTYPKLNDLYIHLQGPDGTDIVLFKQFGGTGSNLVKTVFDDEASTHAALGSAPFTGSFQPLTALSSMDGKLAKGTWKLWVENRGTKTGSVVDWSIIVTPKAG